MKTQRAVWLSFVIFMIVYFKYNTKHKITKKLNFIILKKEKIH